MILNHKEPDMHKQITAMAYTRDRWIEKFRNRFEGAIGEQTKIHLAKAIGMPDYWSDEVEALIADVNNLFNSKINKTKTKFDLYKAAAEAFLEASNANSQIVSAKNEFMNHYLSTVEERIEFKKRIRSLDLAPEKIAVEILKEYMPEHEKKIMEAIKKQLA